MLIRCTTDLHGHRLALCVCGIAQALTAWCTSAQCWVEIAGEIALIRSQKLCRIGKAGYTFSAGDHFVVISDMVVKWKGGYIPTPAEEAQVPLCDVNSVFSTCIREAYKAALHICKCVILASEAIVANANRHHEHVQPQGDPQRYQSATFLSCTHLIKVARGCRVTGVQPLGRCLC